MLAFMLGALLSFLGFARLGFILNFVSGSVIAGFLQAQGLTGKWSNFYFELLKTVATTKKSPLVS